MVVEGVNKPVDKCGLRWIGGGNVGCWAEGPGYIFFEACGPTNFGVSNR